LLARYVGADREDHSSHSRPKGTSFKSASADLPGSPHISTAAFSQQLAKSLDAIIGNAGKLLQCPAQCSLPLDPRHSANFVTFPFASRSSIRVTAGIAANLQNAQIKIPGRKKPRVDQNTGMRIKPVSFRWVRMNESVSY
jgi:hypothetical protein